MRRNQLHSLPQYREYRIQNRQHSTTAEALLWQALKGKQLQGRKFRRQHSIENYIADFYCASAKLVIELDGEVHDETISRQNDQVRDERLEQLGFKVLRFRNEAVTESLALVLQTISQYLM
jgi:very-short-patch-repair endonuclease